MLSILIIVFKALQGLVPKYISKLFTLRNCGINLRGNNILIVPRVTTTSYGLHSLAYQGCKLWNSLPNTIRMINELSKFKSEISKMNFDVDCCIFCGDSNFNCYCKLLYI